jgi:hypothetical protein
VLKVAVFKCERFPELAFYVGEKRLKFAAGRLETEDKAVIEALEKLAEVVRVDEPAAEEKAEEKPKKGAKKSAK